jgi:Rad3-related DNA helicase
MSKTSEYKRHKAVPLNDPAFVWTTYDLGVATALLCADFELLSLDKANPKKVLFVFRKAKNIDETANSYFADQLTLSARSFFDQLKALKNRLYSD